MQLPDTETLKGRVTDESILESRNVSKYFGKSVRCILCDRSNQTLFPPDKRTKVAEPESPDISPQLYRLGYATSIDNTHLPLPKTEKEVSTRLLMRFMESVNLSGNFSVSSFDLDAFCGVLKFASSDDLFIKNWIQRVLEDKCEYKEAPSFFVLLMFIYEFLKSRCHRLMLPLVQACKKKILEYENFFKPQRLYDLEWQDDKEINEFVIKLVRPRADQGYATFLNKMLISLSSNGSRKGRHSREQAASISVFHSYLVEILRSIDSNLIFSFLSTVFTAHTVLFKSITEPSLFKIVVAFYEQQKKESLLVGLLEVLLLRSQQSNDFLSTKYFELYSQSQKGKLTKSFFTIKIRQFTSLKDDYICFFESYKSNYVGIKTGVEELCRVQPHLPQTGNIQVVLVILYLFDTLGIKDMESTFRDICDILRKALVRLDVPSSDFQEFAESHWSRMSKVVLTLQRLSTSEIGVKKKKSLDSLHFCGSSKSIFELLQVARGIEEKAGITSNKIKMRGFTMK